MRSKKTTTGKKKAKIRFLEVLPFAAEPLRKELRALPSNLRQRRDVKPLHLYVGEAFVLRLQRDGTPTSARNGLYDSFLYNKNSIGLFDPTAAFLTHRFDLSPPQVQELASRLGPPILPEPIPLTFVQPPPSPAKLSADPRKPAGAAKPTAAEVLAHTRARGLRVALSSWDPEAGLGMHYNFEESLVAALAFRQADPTQHTSRAYFALQALANQKKDAPPEALLLLALEARAQGAADADKHLEAYVASRREARAECHPLLLLALAREHSGKTIELDCLRCLHSHIPAADRYLTPNELAKVSTEGTVAVPTPLAVATDQPSDRWTELKAAGHSSDAMEKLLKMVGLKKVKAAAVDLFDQAQKLMKADAEFRKKNWPSLNFTFVGNPGTGKTTVGQLLAQVLADSKIRQNIWRDCKAQKLVDDGIDEFRDLVKKVMGGVLLIDEAYMIDPERNPKGKQIYNELLTLAEDQREDISLILCGYQEDLEDKLFKPNPGFQGRFQPIHFEDFDAEDLQKLWEHQVTERGWTCDQSLSRLVAQRLSVDRGQRGFANAREVRRTLELATSKAMASPGWNAEPDCRVRSFS